jgi:hypothetical protein
MGAHRTHVARQSSDSSTTTSCSSNRTGPYAAAIPLSQQAAAAQAAFPHLTIAGLLPAAGPTDSTRITFSDATLGEDT